MAREMNLNDSRVQLGISGTINSNIPSVNFTNQRELLSLGI